MTYVRKFAVVDRYILGKRIADLVGFLDGNDVIVLIMHQENARFHPRKGRGGGEAI